MIFIGALAAALVGGWLALFLVGYLVMHVPTGYPRFFMMLAFMLANISIVLLSHFFLPNITPFLLIFSFTMFLIWNIMNLTYLVYARVVNIE